MDLRGTEILKFDMRKKRLLVLGASGMLGNAVLRLFANDSDIQAFGSVRTNEARRLLPKELYANIFVGADVENMDSLSRLFATVRPNYVVNCIGIVKQLADAEDALTTIPINALLPHRLARLCELVGARLIHMSTDCVFSGSKGMYTEEDPTDAKDLYGQSKRLGEVDYPHAITLRTSIIGHELNSSKSLIGWFLAQEFQVKGFSKAIFSGLPTVELARIIREYVIPHPKLHGLYHVSAAPINKYELLKLVAKIYGKDIHIEEDKQFVVDRSLDSSRFMNATGFYPKPWPELIRMMHDFS